MLDELIKIINACISMMTISSHTAYILLDVLMLQFFFNTLLSKFFPPRTIKLSKADFDRAFGQGYGSDFLYWLHGGRKDANGQYSLFCGLMLAFSECLGKLSPHKWMLSTWIPAAVQFIANWTLLCAVVIMGIHLFALLVDYFYITPRVHTLCLDDPRPESMLAKHAGLSVHLPTMEMRGWMQLSQERHAYFSLLDQLRQLGKSFAAISPEHAQHMPFAAALANLSQIGFVSLQDQVQPVRSIGVAIDDQGHGQTSPRSVQDPVLQDDFLSRCRAASPVMFHGMLHALHRAFSSQALLSATELSDRSGDSESYADALSGQPVYMQCQRPIDALRHASDTMYDYLRAMDCQDGHAYSLQLEALFCCYQDINNADVLLDEFSLHYRFLMQAIHFAKSFGLSMPQSAYVVTPAANQRLFDKVHKNLAYVDQHIQSICPHHARYDTVRHFLQDYCMPLLSHYYVLSGDKTTLSMRHAVDASRHARLLVLLVRMIDQARFGYLLDPSLAHQSPNLAHLVQLLDHDATARNLLLQAPAVNRQDFTEQLKVCARLLERSLYAESPQSTSGCAHASVQTDRNKTVSPFSPVHLPEPVTREDATLSTVSLFIEPELLTHAHTGRAANAF